MEKEGIGRLATLSVRYYAMDRDQRWDRIEKAYWRMVGGGQVGAPLSVIEESYQSGRTDEFLLPTPLLTNGRIRSGDGVLFFNFRADRARQLTEALTQSGFTGFDRPLLSLSFVGMTQYQERFNLPSLFPPNLLQNNLPQLLERAGLKNLRIAETEKYAHVTFFFNGGREAPFCEEDRILIPSPKVSTYDLKPEMSALEVTHEVIKAIEKRRYQTIILNFANADMVGHTGDLKAGIRAVETLDRCVGDIIRATVDVQGRAIITSDHGNVEQMIVPETGEIHTAHTTNPVPCILVDPDFRGTLRHGALQDVAPTLLNILHLEKPNEMTGEDLRVL